MNIFKCDVIENAGDNWFIADFGVDDDGKNYILTTNYIHASELYMVSGGAKADAELVAELLNEYFTKKFEEVANEQGADNRGDL